MDGHTRETGAREIGLALRRRWLFIVALVLLAGGSAFGISKLQQTKYSATAKLLFRTPDYQQNLLGGTGSQSSSANGDPARQAQTNVELVGLPIVASRTSRALDGAVTPRQVSDEVNVSSEGSSDLVSVTVTDPSPQRAQRLANTFAEQFIDFRAETDRSKLSQAKLLAERQYQRLSPAEQTGPRGIALSSAAERLGVLASLQTGNAELVQPAELPSGPSTPKTLRNTMIGAVLGLIIAIGLVYLSERLSHRIREPDEASDAFDLPVLATVPESKAIARANRGSEATPLPFVETECFRTLSASLRYFNVDRGIRAVAVTSGGPGEGKSTVAWHLARAAASSSRSAVLVEADMRKPSLAVQHGLRPAPGLAELLTKQARSDTQVIQPQVVATDGDTPTGEDCKVDVIVSGAIPPNPSELIESLRMTHLLTALRERYDLVVVDTAPTGTLSDAFPLLQKVDGVIVVMRLGETTREVAEHTRERLGRLDAHVLGLVPNMASAKRASYGYGYRYGASDSRESAPPKVHTPDRSS